MLDSVQNRGQEKIWLVLSFCPSLATLDPLTAANTAFALDLFKALSYEDPTANLFFLPFSVSSALAMVYLGTRRDTRAQLAKVRP